MKKMKNFLRLPLKGLFALLAIQAVLFLTVLTIQSCKKSDIDGNRELQKLELSRFNALLKEKKEGIYKLDRI